MISKPVVSGRSATQPPLAKVELRRDADTSQITLLIDGRVRCTATDSDYRRFERVYLRGNNHQLIDNVVVLPGMPQ